MSATVFLQISGPRTSGGGMAAPDPASHPYSGEVEGERDKAATSLPSENPPHGGVCLCPIGQHYDTWPHWPQKKLEKMIRSFVLSHGGGRE